MLFQHIEGRLENQRIKGVMIQRSNQEQQMKIFILPTRTGTYLHYLEIDKLCCFIAFKIYSFLMHIQERVPSLCHQLWRTLIHYWNGPTIITAMIHLRMVRWTMVQDQMIGWRGGALQKIVWIQHNCVIFHWDISS